jgi:prepilin-type N-terminal cleavage/methylation domain-containing protein
VVFGFYDLNYELMNFSFFIKKSQITNHKSQIDSGFTMIELLVAMAIVSILSVLTVTNIRSGSKDQALLRSAQIFASDIKKVQNLALSPKKYDLVDPVCWYGIKIENATDYFLYYHDRAGCTGQVRYSNVFSTKLKTMKLESGIVFTDTTNKDFAFLPPEPMSYFFGNLDFSDQNIVLQINGDIKTRTVTINKFGNVEIQ